MKTKVIDIAKDFSFKPFGRYKEDGKFNGTRFRDEILAPALENNDAVEVKLDGVISFGSSFLEESFGGLIRSKVIDKETLLKKLIITTIHADYKEEIIYYINNPYESR